MKRALATALYWKLSFFNGFVGILVIVGTFVIDKLHSMKWSNMDFDDKATFIVACVVSGCTALKLFLDQTIGQLKRDRFELPPEDPRPLPTDSP